MSEKKRGRPKGRPTGHVRVDKAVKELAACAAEARGITLTEFANQAVAERLGMPWPPSESQQS